MSVISPARPDLAAHREATTTPFPKLVRELVAVIGLANETKRLAIGYDIPVDAQFKSPR